MPVFIQNGTEILNGFDYNKIESDSFIKEANKKFLDNSKQVQDSVRCLYVGQRERATVRFDDAHIDIIGSDDATTCHIVLIVDEITSNCSLCHFDDNDMFNGLENMMIDLRKLRSLSGGGGGADTQQDDQPYSLYIVGGFDDDRNSSIQLTIKLFKLFARSAHVFHLKVCIVTKLNDISVEGVNYPIVYGLGYNIKQKTVFKCNRFIDKGPDLLARSAKHFSQNSIMNIYDTQNSRLVIGPFEIHPFGYIEFVIKQPDSFILENFSTSPSQEPPHFAEHARRTFEFMITHPDLLKTYFVDAKPNTYVKQADGAWARTDTQ